VTGGPPADADNTRGSLEAGTTISAGGITLANGGAIKTRFKDSTYDITEGIFLGWDPGLGTSGGYGFSVGDGTRNITYDNQANALFVSGDIITTGNIVEHAVTDSDRDEISVDVTPTLNNWKNSGLQFTGVPLDAGDTLLIDWGFLTAGEASGPPQLGIRVLIYQVTTLVSTLTLYPTNLANQNWFSGRRRYAVTSTSADYRLYLQWYTSKSTVTAKAGSYLEYARLRR
jgi:hypothetical protein